ncbi:MAG: AAA domain-containing protein [Candidatus Sumerlaeota bacterium]|nr:AAA domain-containing protein [Candidatus Sumerlaeota bacterium]
MSIIESYIEYLRNVSRRIIIKAGFENVLPPEKRNKINFYKDAIIYINKLLTGKAVHINSQDMDSFRYFNNANYYLQTNQDQRLFLGIGLINGKVGQRGKNVCAPLFYAQMDIEQENELNTTKDLNQFILKMNMDTLQLNHDLLAQILDIDIDEEDDFCLSDAQKFKAVQELEDKYINRNNINILNKDLILAYNDFREQVGEFKKIDKSTSNFNYENRLTNLKNDLFNKSLFYQHYFFFKNKIPNELSTYEALNNLLRQKPLKNPLLDKLLNSIINWEACRFDVINEPTVKQVNDVIEKYIPQTLSESQKESIIKAWTNEITYIQGPPGTGKSYTITAILLTAIFLNKKVLLVSHKKAALDVVKEMADRYLGSESILYVGAKDKNSTKDHIQELLNFTHNPNISVQYGNIRKVVIDHQSELENLTSNGQVFKNEIYKCLNRNGEYYKNHKKFLNYRDRFKNIYSIQNLTNYDFKEHLENECRYISAIEKYAGLFGRQAISPVNKIFRNKFIRHFTDRFYAERNLISQSPEYARDIYEINCLYSQSEQSRNNINSERLRILKANYAEFEKERLQKLKIFLPEYMHYYRISKLYNRDMCRIQSNINALSYFKGMLFYRKPSIIVEKWEKIDFESLTNILPLWCSELRDLGSIFPMKENLFDLVIVDESSQVNITEVIPAFYRGKRFCVVGDDKQLSLNATGIDFALTNNLDQILWNNVMNEILNYDEAKEKNLIVTKSSILEFINSNLRGFAIPKSELDEHYRSLPQLASFNNSHFYEQHWKIMTENGQNISLSCFKPIKVEGQRAQNKIVQSEMDEVIKLLKRIIRARHFSEIPELKPFKALINGNPSIGVLSFLTNQVKYLREQMDENFDEADLVKYQIFIATPEEFQGNERDIMIITLGLDGISRWGKGFYENKNRFNVATSRAKYFTYLIYAGIPDNASLIKKYCRHFGVQIKQEDIIPPPEEDVLPKPTWKLKTDKFESEFECCVYEYLKDYLNKHPEVEIYNQVDACGQKRLDFVLFNKDKNITCALEVDGKPHFDREMGGYTEAHMEREGILKRAGWKIVHVKYYDWYHNGWLCAKDNQTFQNELNRLYCELDKNLLIGSLCFLSYIA